MGVIRESLAEQRALRRWHQDASIDEAAWPRVLAELGPRPRAAAWRALFETLTAYLGATLLGAALICVIAYNWEELSKLNRLYGMQLVLLVTGGAAVALGPARTTGRIALLLASVSIGGLFAIIGQTYQTGADTWELFALWAALLLPLAAGGQWAPVWLLWLVVVNIGLQLWLATGSTRLDGDDTLNITAIVNLVLLAAAELAARRWPHAAPRYARRLLLVAVLVPLTLSALVDVFDGNSGTPWGFALWFLVLGALFAHYRYRRIDPGSLGALCASGIAVVTALLARQLSSDSWAIGGLFIALAVVAMAVHATRWLLALRRAHADVD
jgi:uncharacterized membrane protein